MRLLFIAILLFVPGCAGDDDVGPTTPASDTTAPAAVNDLQVQVGGQNVLQLQWTSSGDDGEQGTASAYDVRYSTQPLDDANWSDAPPVSNAPQPALAGVVQSMDLDDLFRFGQWYIGLRVGDEVGNWSEVSNLALLEDIGGSSECYVAAPPAEVEILLRNLQGALDCQMLSTYASHLASDFVYTPAPSVLSEQPESPTEDPWDKAAEITFWEDAFTGNRDVEATLILAEISRTGSDPVEIEAEYAVHVDDGRISDTYEGRAIYTLRAEGASWLLAKWDEQESERPLGRLRFEEPLGEYPVATTENQLIRNFEQAHRDRHFEEYEHLLGENFQFWFAPEDLDLAPNGLFWDRAREVSVIDRMFSGVVGERPDGTPQPAVQNISLTLTPAEPTWIDAGGETVGGITPVPEGVRRRRYNVAMRVTYTEGRLVSEVGGEQHFYVIPTQLDLGGGETVTEWKMLLWRDFGQTTKASTEEVNWGQIKALF